MAVIETWFDQDLQKPVKVRYIDGNLFSHNGNGNRIGVHVYDNGTPVNLGGSVSGYVVTSDGSTVPCTGTRSGNSASILIPAAAYQPGSVFITVLLTDGSNVTTLASVSTNVLQTRTNNQVSPGSVVTDWTNTINAAMQEVVDASVEPNRSIANIVAVGDYVDLRGVTITDGQYILSNGVDIGTNNALSYTDYIEIPDGVASITVNRIVYDDSGRTYPQGMMVWVYDANKNRISYVAQTITDNLLTLYMPGAGAKYARINLSRYHIQGFVKFNMYPSIKYMGYMYENADINDYTTTGFYIVTGVDTVVNLPVKYIGVLTVKTAPFDNYMEQMYTCKRGTFSRYRFRDEWSDWFSLSGGNGTVMQGNYTDLNDLKYNRVYLLSSNSDSVAHLPKTGFLGTVLTFSFDNQLSPGCCQVAISSENVIYVRHTWGLNASWSSWSEILDAGLMWRELGLLYVYHGKFTDREQVITDFVLRPNTKYIVKFNTARTGVINVYGYQNTDSYSTVAACRDETAFTNDGTARYLTFYNPSGQLDPIDVSVYSVGSETRKVDSVPVVYRVGYNLREFDYTSLTQCLYDLRDDVNPKIIEVYEGNYDIYNEYKTLVWTDIMRVKEDPEHPGQPYIDPSTGEPVLEPDTGIPYINPETGEPYTYQRTGYRRYQGTNPSMEYFDYCIWVPKNTHIVGVGIVRIKWEPTATQLAEDGMTAYQTRCVSPLNVAATATIENVEVYCKNGRYCLHNDGLGKPAFTGAVQRYINCRFFKYINDMDTSLNMSYGFNHTTGFGIDRSQRHVYENCVFKNYIQARAFYGHNRISTIAYSTQSPDITLVNCVIDAFIVHKCITAITTPGPWDSSKWTNGIPNSSVTDLQIHDMIANAREWSISSAYAVGDTIYVRSSEYVKFGNSAASNGERIRTMFNSCYIGGLIRSVAEGGSSPACANTFDMTFLNCGSASVEIADDNNPYPPQAFNTNLTVT